jgi:hypothetical protein
VYASLSAETSAHCKCRARTPVLLLLPCSLEAVHPRLLTAANTSMILINRRLSMLFLSRACTRADTALHAAALKGHIACVALLLRHVTTPSTVNARGLTSSQLALAAGHTAAAAVIDAAAAVYSATAAAAATATATSSSSGSDSSGSNGDSTAEAGSKWSRQLDQASGVLYYYNNYTGTLVCFETSLLLTLCSIRICTECM